MANQIKKTDKWFSLYVRLRDALEFQKEVGGDIDISIGRCCTCGVIKQWRYMDCGHFISKGVGGHSGVRWDERNAHLQCKICNAFMQGNAQNYHEFMLARYGETTINELRWLDKNQSYKYKIEAVGLLYKELYRELK